MPKLRRCRTAREEVLDSMSEADWQASVLERAGWRGYRRFHDHDARRDNARAGVDRGFPDCVLLRPGSHPLGQRAMVAELKDEDGEVSPDQHIWLDLFLAMGWETYVWRPSDVDEVDRILDADGPVESDTEWRKVRASLDVKERP